MSALLLQLCSYPGFVAAASQAAQASVDTSHRALAKNAGRTPRENFIEVMTYVVSFSLFYAFVWISMWIVRSPGFRRESSGLAGLMNACVVGDGADYKKDDGVSGEESTKETMGQSAMRLAVCTVGIQVSYLLWGLMQERIMTKPYETGELFRSSKFLVFANRFLALFAAMAGMAISGEPLGRAAKSTPLYKFSFSSVSNILSSVCQYEALKYVSFPTQVSTAMAGGQRGWQDSEGGGCKGSGMRWWRPRSNASARCLAASQLGCLAAWVPRCWVPRCLTASLCCTALDHRLLLTAPADASALLHRCSPSRVRWCR